MIERKTRPIDAPTLLHPAQKERERKGVLGLPKTVFVRPPFGMNVQTPDSQPPKITIDEARRIVLAEAKIADISGVRTRFFDSPDLQAALTGTSVQPVDLMTTQRLLMMQEPELAGFWNSMLFSEQFLGDVLTDMPAVEGTKGSAVDPRFSTQEDIVVSFLKTIFKNDKELLPQLMDAVGARINRSSEENIAEIDAKAEKGELVKKDVIIVGGGPLSTLAASILSPYRNVTIITDEDEIAFDWLHSPFFNNSSVAVDDPMAPRLPLGGGTTTPLTPSQNANMPDTDILLNGNVLRVKCDDGTYREYPAGENIGNFAEMVAAHSTPDFILGQTVIPSEIIAIQNGNNRIALRDKKTGAFRELDCNAVFFIPGPGEEIPKFIDTQSENLYYDSQRELFADIENKKQLIERLTGSIEELRAVPQKPDSAVKINQIEQELATVNITIPPILSLTMLQNIYAFWKFGLQSGPKPFPLEPLFSNKVRIANIGGEDTSRIFEELMKLEGPITAYPEGFDRTDITKKPLTQIHNESAQTIAEYRKKKKEDTETFLQEDVQEQMIKK